MKKTTQMSRRLVYWSAWSLAWVSILSVVCIVVISCSPSSGGVSPNAQSPTAQEIPANNVPVNEVPANNPSNPSNQTTNTPLTFSQVLHDTPVFIEDENGITVVRADEISSYQASPRMITNQILDGNGTSTVAPIIDTVSLPAFRGKFPISPTHAIAFRPSIERGTLHPKCDEITKGLSRKYVLTPHIGFSATLLTWNGNSYHGKDDLMLFNIHIYVSEGAPIQDEDEYICVGLYVTSTVKLIDGKIQRDPGLGPINEHHSNTILCKSLCVRKRDLSLAAMGGAAAAIVTYLGQELYTSTYTIASKSITAVSSVFLVYFALSFDQAVKQMMASQSLPSETTAELQVQRQIFASTASYADQKTIEQTGSATASTIANRVQELLPSIPQPENPTTSTTTPADMRVGISSSPSLSPGQGKWVDITLDNRGGTAQAYILGIGGPVGWDTNLSPDRGTVESGTSVTIRVYVGAPINASTGNYGWTLEVRDLATRDLLQSLSFSVIVVQQQPTVRVLTLHTTGARSETDSVEKNVFRQHDPIGIYIHTDNPGTTFTLKYTTTDPNGQSLGLLSGEPTIKRAPDLYVTSRVLGWYETGTYTVVVEIGSNRFDYMFRIVQ